jgi:hypothetical protein
VAVIVNETPDEVQPEAFVVVNKHPEPPENAPVELFTAGRTGLCARYGG